MVVEESREVIGFDFYGRRTTSLWFCLPRRERRLIAVLLNLAWVFHFACLTMHLVYQSYLEGQTWPGAFWQNSFFVLSIVSQVCAYRVQDAAERKLRQEIGRTQRRTMTHSFYLRYRRGRGSLVGLAVRMRRSLYMNTCRRSTVRADALTPSSRRPPSMPRNAHSTFSPTPVTMNAIL